MKCEVHGEVYLSTRWCRSLLRCKPSLWGRIGPQPHESAVGHDDNCCSQHSLGDPDHGVPCVLTHMVWKEVQLLVQDLEVRSGVVTSGNSVGVIAAMLDRTEDAKHFCDGAKCKSAMPAHGLFFGDDHRCENWKPGVSEVLLCRADVDCNSHMYMCMGSMYFVEFKGIREQMVKS